MIKVNKLFSFLSSRNFLKEMKNVYRVWEKEKCCVNMSRQASVSTAFRESNFLSTFTSSILGYFLLTVNVYYFNGTMLLDLYDVDDIRTWETISQAQHSEDSSVPAVLLFVAISSF